MEHCLSRFCLHNFCFRFIGNFKKMNKYLCNVYFILANIYQLFSTVPILSEIVRLFVKKCLRNLNVFENCRHYFHLLSVCAYVMCCIVYLVKNV